MTDWEWWAALPEDICECWTLGGFSTREEAVNAGRNEFGLRAEFLIIEARSSTARIHEQSDVIPFLKARNEEIVGPSLRAIAKGG
jgi:hypothetical protein